MDESLLLEQLVRSMGESFEWCDEATLSGADDIDSMLAQLAAQVSRVSARVFVVYSP